MENRNEEPNLLGTAVLALVLGFIMLGLMAYAKLQGQPVDTTSAIVGASLLALAALAFEQHKKLKAMTPEDRAQYWAEKQKSWEATADARARAELGDEYRPKR